MRAFTDLEVSILSSVGCEAMSDDQNPTTGPTVSEAYAAGLKDGAAEIKRMRDKLRRISALAQQSIDTGGRDALHPVDVLIIADPTCPLSEDNDAR